MSGADKEAAVLALLGVWAALSLLSPPPTSSDATQVTAQQVFDEANRLMLNEYGGLSSANLPQLRQDYQARLGLVCEALPSCPAAKAYPVLSAELAALHDNHSFLQEPDEYRDFLVAASGGNRKQFGLRLAAFEGEKRLILEVIPNSASALAGLRRGDVLEGLGGHEFHYAALLQARDNGQSVRLQVRRGSQHLTVNLTPRQSSTRDLPSLSWLTAGQKRVALLKIPSFLTGGGAAQMVHDLVRQAQDGQAAAVLVDLRGNGGGDLSECDAATSAFVPSFERLSRSSQGSARVQVKAGARLEDDLMLSSITQAALWEGPLAILVDSESASCSEFFAYEVQYAQRPQAVVVGQETAGVGNTATRLFPLPSGAALQLTILNYLKPDGTPYPEYVTPNIKAVTDPLQLSQGKDSMVEAALQALGL